MMEGKLSGEGLHSMDDDMLAAMARELVEKGGVDDSADAVWEELRKERTAHLPPTPAAEAVPAMEIESEISDMFAGLRRLSPHSQPDQFWCTRNRRRRKHCGRQGMSLAISYDSSDNALRSTTSDL